MDLSDIQFARLLRDGCGAPRPEYAEDDGSFELRYGPVTFGQKFIEQKQKPTGKKYVCRNYIYTTVFTAAAQQWTPSRDVRNWLALGRELASAAVSRNKLHILAVLYDAIEGQQPLYWFPRFVPYTREEFDALCDDLNVPRLYLWHRLKGDYTGICYHRSARAENNFRQVQIVKFPEMYMQHDLTLLLVFDAKTGTTYAVIEGLSVASNDAIRNGGEHQANGNIASPVSPGVLAELQNALEHSSGLTGHPLHLPLVLLDLYVRENLDESNALHREFGYLEESTSITSWYTIHAKSRNTRDLHHNWNKAPQTQNRLPFHERRWAFIANYVDFLLEEHDAYRSICEDLDRPLESAASTLAFEILMNYKRLAADNKSEIQCLYRRSENMVNLLATFLAQKSSESAQKTTGDMSSIAILTFFFLPATFVATLFSTVFLRFDPGADAKLETHDFWIYWAVTIPLTLVLVLIWSCSFLLRKLLQTSFSIRSLPSTFKSRNQEGRDTKIDAEKWRSERALSSLLDKRRVREETSCELGVDKP